MNMSANTGIQIEKSNMIENYEEEITHDRNFD